MTKVPRSARPCFLDQHVEIARERRGRIADQRVLDLLDGVRGVVPGLVREVRVGGHAVDLDAQLLEFGVVVGEIAEFGRADEGEIGRVEHDHGPLALEALVASPARTCRCDRRLP